ncbi:hypothetical protein C0992_006520 [Termitomyces sp. T32_za158]|nr:hypothetical protein C0992_006520 [Termitomyces sp. T32_za158]
MEQTTTWLCPVCERVLDSKELIVDGYGLFALNSYNSLRCGRYFDEILKQTPDDVEDVIVEADGEWHTSDNKYGSATWKASHSVAAVSARTAMSQPISRSPSKVDMDGKAKAEQQVYVLDSDDEDEGRVKRELSPSLASNSQSYDGSTVPQTSNQADAFIDLTLDSDDEEPPPTIQTGKRKAIDLEPPLTSPSELIWKKSRIDASTVRTTDSDYNTSQPAISRSTVQNPSRYPPYQDPHPSTYAPTYPLPSIDNLYSGTSSRWS